ncbi:putative proteasome-type protease [Frankineae bacterium MT45]|nr:putative proteasome-type protease [Frankineae bacterium MT45]
MTYCLALRLDDGLVFLADTRTNAGVDNIGSYRKLHVIDAGPDRAFVLESAGNLATTQQVLDYIHRDLSGDGESLATVSHLFEAALYVGRLSQQVIREHQGAFASALDATATFILGGQIAGGAPDILLVYPEGNYTRASDERPFLQIGELKYGKFMLDLAVRSHVDIDTASKIAIGSMMSTATANLSVGPPYDLGIYRPDSFTFEQLRIPEDSPVIAELRSIWEKHIVGLMNDLPGISAGAS